MSASDTAHDGDPSNWVSLIWRLTRGHPAFWMFAFFFVYLVSRVLSNVDALDPVVDAAKRKLNLLNVDAAVVLPTLSGEWDYLSKDQNSGKKWGGLITISVTREGKMERIKVQGNRTWEEVNGERVDVSPAIPWEADGAAYSTDTNQIQWRYLTHDARTIQGVTFVTAKVGRLEGGFSDLYEAQPRWGIQVLRRHATPVANW
jgi:hypothetical protein